MMDMILFSAALSLLILGLFLLMKNRQFRRMPPGPTGVPIFGYLPLVGKHPAKTYFNLSKTYGSVFSMNLAGTKTVTLNDYESIQEALVKNSNAFSGRPVLAPVADSGTTGLGIVTRTYDENFKKLRKFTLTSMRSYGFGKKSMEDKITEEIDCFMGLLRSKNKTRFNDHTDFATSVSNVLCNITLGRRFPYEDRVFRKMVDLVNDSFSDRALAITISLINIFPSVRFLPIISWQYARFRKDLEYVRDFIRESIKEHQDTFDENHSRDFIDDFIKEIGKVGKDDPCFNEDQLTFVLHDLFVAGTETTSSTLRWCVLLLAHRPDIQQNLFKEIVDVIGDSKPSMKHRDSMPYTQAFLHEMTRHRTLAILAVPHMTTSGVNFRSFYIPAGTLVLPNIWAVHHDPENFKNPDDFDPERFIDSESGKFVQHKRVIPFSIGPRYCLGEQLAKMELFLFLTNIVQNFKIAADPDSPLPDFNIGVVGAAEVPQEYEVSYTLR